MNIITNIRSAAGLGIEAVKALFAGGQRFTTPDRMYVPGYVQDARFDADSSTRVELMRKARYFEANTDIVNILADLRQQYVSGPKGLVVTSDSEDPEWRDSVMAWFDQWARFPDPYSMQSWATMQGLLERSKFIDGEAFILKTRSPRPPYYPRLQLIPSHHVATPPELANMEGVTIFDGIELERIDGSIGRPVAYYVRDRADQESYRRVPASKIIHYYEPSRIDQIRGITELYPVLGDLIDLEMLQTMQMRKCKDAADISVAIINEHGAAPAQTPGVVRARYSDSSSVTPSGSSETKSVDTYYRKALGGRMLYLRRGDDIKQFRNETPGVADQFIWNFLRRKVCAGTGISYNMAFPESMNGTMARADLAIATAYFRSRSEALAAVVREAWIYVVSEGSNIDVDIADKPSDWTNISIRPPRAPDVDIGRNSAAMISEWKAGLKTLEEICGSAGQDWKVQLRKRAIEAKTIRELANEFELSPSEISDVIESAIQPAQQPEPQGVAA